MQVISSLSAGERSRRQILTYFHSQNHRALEYNSLFIVAHRQSRLPHIGACNISRPTARHPPWLPHASPSSFSPLLHFSLLHLPSWLHSDSVAVPHPYYNTLNQLHYEFHYTHNRLDRSPTPPWRQVSTRHRRNCRPSSQPRSRAWSMTQSDWYVKLSLY
jgi:hypothetical protein